MNAITYSDSMTLREARRVYFEANKFGADGGYGDRWVPLKAGPLTFYMLNTKERVRAVRLHDLHHIVTGYQTDWVGEFEISAFEIGGGCRDYIAAWILNLSGMTTGLALCPRRLFRAFVRGRHSQNLYRTAYDDALLGATVGEMRGRLGLDRPPGEATAADAVLFGLACLAGVPIGLTLFGLGIVSLPYGLVSTVIARRRAARPERT
jgi:hypothetical protein